MLTPLFAVPVPVLPHELAEPDKGSGIAMICTFGDLTDVTWWRDLALPTRSVVGRDGRLGPAPFGTRGLGVRRPGPGELASYAEIEGLPVKRAQARIVELLRDSGDLLGEPRAITHAVKYYERGKRPLEIVTSSQWYVRTLERREALLRPGARVEMAPRVHAGPLRGLGGRPHGRLEHLAAAFLRCPVPGLVQARRRGRACRRRPPARLGRSPAGRPVHRCP